MTLRSVNGNDEIIIEYPATTQFCKDERRFAGLLFMWRLRVTLVGRVRRGDWRRSFTLKSRRVRGGRKGGCARLGRGSGGAPTGRTFGRRFFASLRMT